MKYKLLSVISDTIPINIGDYIQALAAAQFFPNLHGFVHRERLNQYNDDLCAVIMNGWFMDYPQNWPPTDKINPLFVAFHISTYTRGKMLSPEGISYLKKYEPIGCRDYYTCNCLAKEGVKSYFSGCMTLTLGEKYHNPIKDNKVYFVDPFFKCRWSKTDLIKNIPYYLCHKKIIDCLEKKMESGLTGIKKKLRVVDFYKEYSKFFTKGTLLDAIFISQQGFQYNDKFKSDDVLLAEAERLVKAYAKAGLVVTSRIHCALPCLGLETPVVFVENKEQDIVSSCRLDGLRELFNVLEWKDGKLHSNFQINDKLSMHNAPINKNNWRNLSEELKNTVNKFLNNVDL